VAVAPSEPMNVNVDAGPWAVTGVWPICRRRPPRELRGSRDLTAGVIAATAPPSRRSAAGELRSVAAVS
jgi:hypothetical protein